MSDEQIYIATPHFTAQSCPHCRQKKEGAHYHARCAAASTKRRAATMEDFARDAVEKAKSGEVV